MLLVLTQQAVFAQPLVKRIVVRNEGYYASEVKYPQFKDRSAVVRVINKAVVLWARKEQRRFRRACEGAIMDLGKPIAPFEHKVDFVVTHSRPASLISVKFQVYEHAGGPRGNSRYVAFNVGRIGGRARALTFGDFFGNDSAAMKQVSDAVFTRLKEDERAASVAHGELSGLTIGHLDKFVVVPDGLVFLFDESALGPGIAGPVEVKLTLDELGDAFNAKIMGDK